MKLNELRPFDIIAVDHNAIINDGRPVGYYMVVVNEDGEKVAINFRGNCNCEDRPSGWYDLADDTELPFGTIGVVRPKWFAAALNGEFSNEKVYDLVWGELPPDIPAEKR